VLAGIALAIWHAAPEIHLTKALIFDLLLPPLVFEAALYIRWPELRRELPVILTLSTAGVALSAAVTAAGMHYVLGWQWAGALVFGALIAATDPVSVIATFKEAGVHGRLRLLVEAESLFNDSTAAIAFTIAIAFATGQSVGTNQVVTLLAGSIGGGLLAGSIVAGALLVIAGRTTDHLVELTLSTIAAYASFLIAERYGGSGVLAAMTAGLMFGNLGMKGPISESGRQALESFWDYAAFVANSLIFLLIGVRDAQENLSGLWATAVVSVVLVMAGRAIAIYPLCAIWMPSSQRVDRAHQHVLFWGGLRGALALALALGLPEQVPHSREIVTITFAVVAFSVLVQGLTMKPMLRALGQIDRKQ